jgi:hypothetical protein
MSASDGRLSVLGGDRPVPPMKLKSTEFYELVRAIGTRCCSLSSLCLLLFRYSSFGNLSRFEYTKKTQSLGF